MDSLVKKQERWKTIYTCHGCGSPGKSIYPSLFFSFLLLLISRGSRKCNLLYHITKHKQTTHNTKTDTKRIHRQTHNTQEALPLKKYRQTLQMTKEALSKHFEYKLIHTYTNLTVIRAHPKNDPLSSRRSPTKSYLAFQQNLTMLLNKFLLSAFQDIFTSVTIFQTNSNKILLRFWTNSLWHAFQDGYHFSNKFLQNLTTLNKFLLTCFSRYFQVGYHFSKEKTISNLNLRWC